MRRRRKDSETFNLSFLDVICCGFGAVILLLVLTKIYEPSTIEQSREEAEKLLAALQEELFDLRGTTVVMRRELKETDIDRVLSQTRLNELKEQLAAIQGEFESLDEKEAMDELQGELQATRQELTEEMRRLLENYTPPEDQTTVGGVPVDSEYIIFVIDTSGSMRSGVWPLVQQKVKEALDIYPRVRGIQVLNDEGAYMVPRYAGRWMPDSPSMRLDILKRLRSWRAYSDSSPVEGITEAINTFYEPGRKVSIYIFGDDFPRGSVEAVARYVERVNKADEFGNRLVRIHAVGFPTQFAGGAIENGNRFANLMRALCERNGGTFVALTSLR